MIAAGLITSSSALASGTPNVQLSSSAGNPLYGETSSFTATASLANGEPNGYNLSFRVVLPAGITYAGGSAITPTVIINQSVTGQTTSFFT